MSTIAATPAGKIHLSQRQFRLSDTSLSETLLAAVTQLGTVNEDGLIALFPGFTEQDVESAKMSLVKQGYLRRVG